MYLYDFKVFNSYCLYNHFRLSLPDCVLAGRADQTQSEELLDYEIN